MVETGVVARASICFGSSTSSFSLLSSFGQRFSIRDFQLAAFFFFYVHSQLSFLEQSLSTNITLSWLLWASFEATRAVAFSHGGQHGSYFHMVFWYGSVFGSRAEWHFHMVGSTGQSKRHPTPGPIGSRPGGAPGNLGKKRRFGKFGRAREAWGGEAVYT